MEFGIFIQGYLPPWKREAGGQDAEHTPSWRTSPSSSAADRYGLQVRSGRPSTISSTSTRTSRPTMSCSPTWRRATERIHLGSGIFNPLARGEPPGQSGRAGGHARPRLEGRFEFGTGRGAGSHEILGFLPGWRISTARREIWEEVIGEFPKMWMQDDYEGFDGKYWSLPPRKILPKPYAQAPPGHVVRRRQSGELRDGGSEGARRPRVLRELRDRLAPVLEAYKKAIVERRADRRVRERQRHGDDGRAPSPRTARRAYRLASEARMNYLQSNVFRYHDTFPHPEPGAAVARAHPRHDAATSPRAGAGGAMIVGDPDDALAQCRRWESAGADQLVLGVLGPDRRSARSRPLR